MESLEQIKGRAEAAIPGAKIDIVPNPGPANQPSLLIDNEHVVAVARFLRTDPALFLDFCSNVTGVDWLDRVVKKTTECARLPSLTPVWRSAEFQEREIFDLYGIHFDGHPDLRRILMWDEFEDHPMRKDYVQPDDFEWEPTPHDDVLARVKQHYPPRPQMDGAEKITATDSHG